MEKRIQAKHVPEDPILAFLRSLDGRWSTHHHSREMPSIPDEVPAVSHFPERVLLAKLRSMMRRGLIHGCGCGCRGDWHIDPVREQPKPTSPAYISIDPDLPIVPTMPRRPVFVVPGIGNPVLIHSCAHAVEVLGAGAAAFFFEPFITGSGNRGIWAIPHPDDPR